MEHEERPLNYRAPPPPQRPRLVRYSALTLAQKIFLACFFLIFTGGSLGVARSLDTATTIHCARGADAACEIRTTAPLADSTERIPLGDIRGVRLLVNHGKSTTYQLVLETSSGDRPLGRGEGSESLRSNQLEHLRNFLLNAQDSVDIAYDQSLSTMHSFGRGMEARKAAEINVVLDEWRTSR